MREARSDVLIGHLYTERQEEASSRARETNASPSGMTPADAYYTYVSNSSFIYIRLQLKEAVTYNAQVSIHSRNPLVCTRLQQLARNQLLDRKHHTVFAADSDSGVAVLDSLHGIFNLEVAAVRGEDRVLEIVACAYRRLGEVSKLVPRL